MTGTISQRQPFIGYLGVALLAIGAQGPIASSSFFGDLGFLWNGSGTGFLLMALALASAVLVYLRKYEWLWLSAGVASLLCVFELLFLFLGHEAGQAQLAGLSLGVAFVDFANTYWGSVRIGWGVPVVILGVAALVVAAIPAIPAAKTRLAQMARTKTYDVIIALPLVLFFVNGAAGQIPLLNMRFGQLAAGTASLTATLQTVAILSFISFSLLLVVLVFIRSVPVGKARNFGPRVVAILGTFAVTAVLYLPVVDLPLWLQIIALALSIVGNILSFVVLLKLGRSFSIMPEARTLITTGPYAVVRHPLYLVEEFAIVGLLIQFASPFALGLGIAHLTLQYMRTEYEERVLTATFPEYESYRKRTRWRFIPGLL